MSLKYSKSLSPMDSSYASSSSDASNIEHQEQNICVPSVNFLQEIKAAIYGWIGSKVSKRFAFLSDTTYYYSCPLLLNNVYVIFRW